MTNEREKYERVLTIAIGTRKALLEAEVDPAFAAQIEEQITRKAGSYLPPITGTFSAELSATLRSI